MMKILNILKNWFQKKIGILENIKKTLMNILIWQLYQEFIIQIVKKNKVKEKNDKNV